MALFLGQRSIESINNFFKSKSMKTDLLIIKKKTLSCFMFHFINVTFRLPLNKIVEGFILKPKVPKIDIRQRVRFTKSIHNN